MLWFIRIGCSSTKDMLSSCMKCSKGICFGKLNTYPHSHKSQPHMKYKQKDCKLSIFWILNRRYCKGYFANKIHLNRLSMPIGRIEYSEGIDCYKLCKSHFHWNIQVDMNYKLYRNMSYSLKTLIDRLSKFHFRRSSRSHRRNKYFDRMWYNW